MSYSCHFCGDIEENDILFRCSECGGEKVSRSAGKVQCADCESANETVTAICPTCGSDELEA